ncbi:MAG: hypothetical protein FWC64_07035 [Treponema sp.]|nr:hypothetical protein [Treponema sp.]
MAVLKSVFKKEKEYIFTAFGNDKAEQPAKVIFKRFPLDGETFQSGRTIDIRDSKVMKNFDNSIQAQEELIETIVNDLVDNMMAQRIDYKRFVCECVERVENLVYDGRNIETADAFLSLPQDAVSQIAGELYTYARQSDTFSASEKKS